MSRLEQLLSNLCPNGIEYKKLSEIATVSRGVRVVREQLKAEGEIPVYQNSLKPLGYHDKSNVTANTAFVIGAGAAGEIGFSDVEFWAADDCYYIVCPEELDDRYLYYALMKNHLLILSRVRKASIPRLSRAVIENLVIPIPPIKVQIEIVKILDEYTESITALQQELEKELTARKKQYEYYRDLLLDFGVHGGATGEFEWRTISEIAKTNIGLATSVTQHKVPWGVRLLHNSDIQQNQIVLKNEEFISEEFATKNQSKRFKKHDIITVHTGDVGTSAVIEDEYVDCIGFTTITTRIIDTRYVSPYYLCHYLNSHICKLQIASMTISDRSNLNQKMFDTLRIPIPSIEEQERIVSILDRFDKLCNDLIEGLPAEIEARRKQYEYYRDKLLSF